MAEHSAGLVDVLLIEDEATVASFVMAMFRREGNYRVEVAGSLRAALDAVERRRWDVLVADLSLPDGDGTDAIAAFRKRNVAAGIIVITGYPDETKVRRLESYEISSFLVKPFDGKQLKYSVIGALERSRLSGHSEAVGVETEHTGDLGLVGVSDYIRELRDRIRQLARVKIPVLICGPSGTGKEIIARAIHAESQRHRQPIFAINCAAIPRHLEESEFFGYVKGAFTGATANKNGIIASADGSTLFLDEIGELSLPVQAKLLRVLDSGEYLRIGEVQPRIVDTRVVSATNRDLDTMVASGAFRHDLFFRLRGAMITTRPLAEHREDIPHLVHHFLVSETGSRLPAEITQEALELLRQREWPGDVRELRLAVSLLRTASYGARRINAVTVRRVLKVQEEPLWHAPQPFHSAKVEFERSYFTNLLEATHGNVAHAARMAGLHRPNLARKLRGLDIDPEHFRFPGQVSKNH
jgi:DNA-binding NtrC family response regulator